MLWRLDAHEIAPPTMQCTNPVMLLRVSGSFPQSESHFPPTISSGPCSAVLVRVRTIHLGFGTDQIPQHSLGGTNMLVRSTLHVATELSYGECEVQACTGSYVHQ